MNCRKFKNAVIALSMLVLLSFSVLSYAGGVTNAPTIMPNFPMLAGTNVMIMWLPVPGAVKYKIYLNGKEIGESPPGLPFNAPAPTDAGVYRYSISGLDPNGEEGPMSPESNLTITKIEQPKNISHQFLGELMNIRWDKAPSASIYDLYRAGPYPTKDSPDGSKAEYKLLTSITETRYVDSEVKDGEDFYGKTYFYKVVSKDKFNKTSPDTEFYQVDIVEPIEDLNVETKSYSLKIQRTKEVKFAKPLGQGTGVQSNYDCVFNKDGTEMIYIDLLASRIGVVDQYGDWVANLGSFGPKEGQFKTPTSISLDTVTGNIILSDQSKQVFMVFDDSYKQIGTYPIHFMD
ncbi:hypothetical protein ACFL2A_07525, partial [Thermodesulfobacteriota bacterium]